MSTPGRSIGTEDRDRSSHLSLSSVPIYLAHHGRFEYPYQVKSTDLKRITSFSCKFLFGDITQGENFNGILSSIVDNVRPFMWNLLNIRFLGSSQNRLRPHGGRIGCLEDNRFKAKPMQKVFHIFLGIRLGVSNHPKL